MHAQSKALSLLITSFLESAIMPKFQQNLYHHALYKWHIEEVRNITAPPKSPNYDENFFSSIKEVRNEGLLNILTMTSGMWYRVLVENMVTHQAHGNSIDYIPCRAERNHPTVDWERTWSLAVAPGLSSLTSLSSGECSTICIPARTGSSGCDYPTSPLTFLLNASRMKLATATKVSYSAASMMGLVSIWSVSDESKMDPSDVSTEDYEARFFLVLKDDGVRKTYNKTLDLGKSYQRKFVNIAFLKSCIENDVVPNSFRISNQPQSQSQKFCKRWTSAAKQASLAWIKMTISEEEEIAKEIFENYRKSLNLFGRLIPEDLHEFCAKKFEEKNDNLKKNIEKDKLRKLAHLKEKFGTGENSELRQNMERRNRSRRFVKKSVWTRRQRKFRNRGVKLYFNYSKIPISPAMDSLLNRGLNYCITPSKVNVTELLIDMDKFVRKFLWREFFYDQPSDEKRKEPIVKNEKTNLPKKHKTPEKLKMFLHATTSDLLDTKTRNKVHNNLPPEELEALKQLIELQKNRVITIKPADKGAGIVILEFDDYIKSCYDHLGDTQKQPDDTLESYY